MSSNFHVFSTTRFAFSSSHPCTSRRSYYRKGRRCHCCCKYCCRGGLEACQARKEGMLKNWLKLKLNWDYDERGSY
ncbi:uncharacterized protein LOC108347023 isoform X6 [Vigna angularis]|uniref:uncharacterized protein LOC108347023 isoform X6 n=1 Tax=Phaseolus angularis TaxID=3914 RepID=UPI0022B5BDFC|nr:uncharacterized protein LOC108347023 isoform X6 [Vigna angularis]